METNELIFRKFCLKFERIAKRGYWARYRDGSFETLPKLFYGTSDDNRDNIAG